MEPKARLDPWFSIVIPVLNEEQNIPELLHSIHRQSYRPIETIVVDDGSTDRTVQLAEQLARGFNEEDFLIFLVRTANGSPRGPAGARNLGINTARGDCLLLVDADFVLTENNIVKELQAALQEHGTAHFRTRMMKDTWLEYNLALDSATRIFRKGAGGLSGTAFRKEVLLNLQFDEGLGAAEDIDFLEKLAGAGIPFPFIISSMGARHRPHTLTELKQQRKWYGRTAVILLERKLSPTKLGALAPSIPIVLLMIAFLALFLHRLIGLLVLAAFLAVPFSMFLRSSKKTAGRLVYLIFIRYVYESFYFFVGLLQGMAETMVHRRIGSSREQ